MGRAHPGKAPRWRRALLAAPLLLLLCATPSPARADTLDAMVSRYTKHPRAPLAWRIATAYRKRGHIGKAMNWGERVMISPGLTPALQRQVGAMREDLRWDLRDAGYGKFKLRVYPAWASVIIDDQVIRPRRAVYHLWLPEGSHQLSVSAVDHGTVTRAISASRGEQRAARVILKLTRRPELRMDVVPENAEVWVNRQFMGYASRRIFRLKPGAQLVELRAQGYDPYVKTYVMKSGERHRLVARLSKTVIEHMRFRVASNVKRKLTPLELANRGERHRGLGRSQVGAAAPTMRPKDESWGGGVSRDAPKSTPDGGDMEFDEEDFDQIPTAEIALGHSLASARSKVGRGMLWAGLGLLTLGGGVGTALYGVRNARTANALRVGHKGYSAYYDQAARVTFIGYGTAGVGGIATAIGGMYLFGRHGLRRAGKGWMLTGVGVATAGLGAYLMLDAVAEAEAANKLAEGHASYDPNFDGAERLWWAGAAAALVGGGAAAAGVYLIATTKPAEPDSTASVWRRVALAPRVGPRHTGAVLSLSW